MKALTLHAEWAWAIVHAGKRVENRTWAPLSLVGERLAIHAGSRVRDLPGMLAACRAARVEVAVEDGRPESLFVDGRSRALVRSAIVATALVVEIVPDSSSPWALPGCWHWVLDEVEPVTPPLACAGKQGLWPAPRGGRALGR